MVASGLRIGVLYALLVSSVCATAVEVGTAPPAPAKEFDRLVEPIALYPDVLLKAMLPASTFPDQIVDAVLLTKSEPDAPQLIRKQSWDDSVKVIATYPGVLKMMFKKLEWTTELGKAFLNHHREVLGAIQRARRKAKEDGTLNSSKYQTVTETSEQGNTVIIVQPAEAGTVYVPETSIAGYDQGAATESGLVPLASFGIGMALGAAMSDEPNEYYYSGGYWGGPVYWGANDNFDEWVDHRNDVWEEYNERRGEQQEFRQGRHEERQQYRQDMAKQGGWALEGDQAAQRRERAVSQTEEFRRGGSAGDQAGQGQAVTRTRDPFDTTSGSRIAGSSVTSGQSPRASLSRGGAAFGGYGSGGRVSAASTRGAASRARTGGGGRRR